MIRSSNAIRLRKRPNDDLRQFAKEHGVRHWELAELNLISEVTFSKNLRHELPPEEKEIYMKQIREIAESRRN